MDIAGDAQVIGEVEGSIDAEACNDRAGGAVIGEVLNRDGWAVGAGKRKAASELGYPSTLCSRPGLGVRPACEAKDASEPSGKSNTLQGGVPPKNIQ